MTEPEISDEVFAREFERRFGITLSQFAEILEKHAEVSGLAFQELEQISTRLEQYTEHSR